MKTVTGQYLPPTDGKLVAKLFARCQEEYRARRAKETARIDRIQVRTLTRPQKRMKKAKEVPQ